MGGVSIQLDNKFGHMFTYASLGPSRCRPQAWATHAAAIAH